MDWTFLGHAGWLVEAAGLRVLMDPLLAEAHHEGTFAVHPDRRVDAAGLRPDLLLITHRHLDHFDLPTLRLLAEAGARPLVVTPDVLVAKAAEVLGFEVCVLEAWAPLRLDGLTLLPTPSLCAVREWGVWFHTPEGTAWNQVDTELRSAADVRAILTRTAEITGAPGPAGAAPGPDLGIVRWQPLRQVEMLLSDALGMSLPLHARHLQIAAATGAGLTLPGACGARYLPPSGWMDAHAFPLTPARFFRDLRALRPDLRTAVPVPGDVFCVRGGEVVQGARSGLVELLPDVAADQRFLPWSIPELRDPAPAPGEGCREDSPLAQRAAEIDAWIASDLLPGLAREAPGWGLEFPVRLGLRLVWPGPPGAPPPHTERTFTVDRGPGGAVTVMVGPGMDADCDAAVGIAASELRAVIAGRATWGRPLLGGLVRATVRGWRVTAAGPARAAVPPIFLYAGLSFDRSFLRWLERELGVELLQPPVEGGEPAGGAGGEQGLGG